MKIEKRAELGQSIIDLINSTRAKKGKNIKGITFKSTGQSEGVAADGGNTVFHDIVPDILAPNFAEGTLYADSRIFNVGEKSNGLKIPIAAQTTRTSTSIKGGVRGYIVGEGATKTPSTGQFSQLDLQLNKIAAVVYCTDELLQDSVGMASYISEAQKEAIFAKVDYEIVYGVGNGLNGIDSAAATGFASISSPITAAELKNIYDLYYGGKNGKWYLAKDIYNEITDLYMTAANGSIPLVFTSDGPILWGLPVIISDVMTDRSILLADLTQYVIIQKGLKEDINTSLKWVEDESCLRSVYRINGASSWATPITLADGSVVHPFVMATGEEKSSSSSESSDSSSYSSVSSESSSIDSHSSLSSVSSQSRSSQSLSSASSQSLSSATSQSLSTQSQSSSTSSSTVAQPTSTSSRSSQSTSSSSSNDVTSDE